MPYYNVKNFAVSQLASTLAANATTMYVAQANLPGALTHINYPLRIQMVIPGSGSVPASVRSSA